MIKQRILAVPVVLWIAFFLFAGLMLAIPGIDLAVSRLFWTPETGFVPKGLWWERLVYHGVEVLLVVVGVGLILLWLLNRRRRHKLLGVTGRKAALLLALVILVPGLLVNQGFKENLGRARAVKLEQFGGHAPFTPAFVPSPAGGGSFSSGHAATGFWLVAVAYTLTGRLGVWTLLALAYALILGLTRIAVGGHFLSDVIASGFFVWIGWYMLAAVICGDRSLRCDDGGSPGGPLTDASGSAPP
jgi:lipid A 4'-phosphatase